MSSGLIIRILPLAPVMVTSPTPTDAAFPAANLADAQPKVVWKSTGLNASIDIDLGVDTAFDTVALLFTNLSAAATITVFATTSAQGYGALGAHVIAVTSPARAPVSTNASRFHTLRIVAAQVARFVQIQIVDTAANADGVIRAGIAVVGQSWQQSVANTNFELGSGRKVTDLSDKRQLPGGENGRWRKAKVPGFRATWSSSTDGDLRILWSILLDIGLSEPVLLIEDPDITAGLHERIHYATLDALDFYEREQVDKSKIEIKVTDWL